MPYFPAVATLSAMSGGSVDGGVVQRGLGKLAQKLLKAAGFGDIRVETVHNRYPIRYWAQLFPFPNGLKSGLLNLLQKSRVGRVIVPLPAGNLAAIAYKQ